MAANVLIMAGGTGGHVFPALACAREFQARGYAVHWLGTPRGIENELVPAAGLPLHLIQVSGLRGKGLASLIKAPLQLVRSLFQARRIIRELRPVCVLGLGGYVTGPGGLAAKLAGVPLVIHEQNAVAGTANRSLVADQGSAAAGPLAVPGAPHHPRAASGLRAGAWRLRHRSRRAGGQIGRRAAGDPRAERRGRYRQP